LSAISDARDRFISEQGDFKLLAAEIEGTLLRLMRQEGIACRVSTRVKDVSSFVGKSIRKGYDDPWRQITDKVGARITLADATNTEGVVALIRGAFEVTDFQDKARSLWNKDKIGYSGVHLQIKASAENVVGECELQVRSEAQNLWSEMSHRLLYKPGVEVDDANRRALTRLAAPLEIFDEEVKRGVDQMLAAPGYEIESLISVAESELYKFSESTYDRSLSRYVIGQIGASLPTQPLAVYAESLADFTEKNADKLHDIYRRYEDQAEPVLLHQPEAVIVFERIEGARHTLEELWEGRLPRDEFDALCAIWG